MINPEKKAIELKDKFRDENLHFENDILEAARQTAIDVVDIILEEYNSFTVKFSLRIEFWNKVKTELQNLKN